MLSRLIAVPRSIAAPGKNAREWRLRIATIATFHGLWHGFGYLYDNWLWWAAILYFGVFYGNLLMSIGAFLINIIMLRRYLKNGKDWLGVGILDDIRENGSKKSWSLKIVSWLLKKGGDKLAFFVLSCGTDSFITTAYLRHGDFSPIEKKDFVIFFSSILLSCAYWSIRSSLVVGAAKFLWRLLRF